MEPTKDRLKADLNLLATALSTLEEALQEPLNDIVRDAVIQRFEYVFELAWKSMQVAAAYMGIRCASPRDAIKAAFKLEWIKDADAWLEALEARNQTSHTYHAALAREVYQVAKKFPSLVRGILDLLRTI